MFFLYFNRKNKPSDYQIDSRDVIQHLTPFGAADKSGSIEKGRVLLVQCVTWNTAPSVLEPAPFYDTQTKISIASWARIDNREELAHKLDISRSEADSICDSELILKCYLKWQENCVDHLIGGINSSTITAYGARFFEQPLTRFHTFAFANIELEPQHILAVSQAYGLPYNHVIAGRRLNREAVKANKKFAKFQPFTNKY